RSGVIPDLAEADEHETHSSHQHDISADNAHQGPGVERSAPRSIPQLCAVQDERHAQQIERILRVEKPCDLAEHAGRPGSRWDRIFNRSARRIGWRHDILSDLEYLSTPEPECGPANERNEIPRQPTTLGRIISSVEIRGHKVNRDPEDSLKVGR